MSSVAFGVYMHTQPAIDRQANVNKDENHRQLSMELYQHLLVHSSISKQETGNSFLPFNIPRSLQGNLALELFG
jgi:hypothetical protein